MAGLRSLTPPAVAAWAAYWGWLDVHNSFLGFIATAPARYLFLAAAIGELIADKVPSAPDRTTPVGLVTRIVTGAFTAIALSLTLRQSLVAAALLGALGAVVGAFAGYEVRRRLVQKSKLPDFVVAIVEDALAIAGSLFLAVR